jgi:hypothetical protein
LKFFGRDFRIKMLAIGSSSQFAYFSFYKFSQQINHKIVGGLCGKLKWKQGTLSSFTGVESAETFAAGAGFEFFPQPTASKNPRPRAV